MHCPGNGLLGDDLGNAVHDGPLPIISAKTKKKSYPIGGSSCWLNNGSAESAVPSPVRAPVRNEPSEAVREVLLLAQKLITVAADAKFMAEN